MRIVLINQFYPPDVAPTGRYLRDLAVTLADRGHDVSVICSRLSYAAAAEDAGSGTDRVREVRVGAAGQEASHLVWKALGYVKFMIQSWWVMATMKPRPEVVVALTTPPWIGWVASMAVGRRCRRVHWIMDLYPHVLVAHRLIKAGTILHRLLARMTRNEWKRADRIITLGPAMTDLVQREGSGLPEQRIQTIPLWSLDQLAPWDEDQVNRLREQRGWAAQTTVLMYTGNMGHGHEFAWLLEMMRSPDMMASARLAFAGWGVRQCEVERYILAHPEVPVELLSPVETGWLREHLCSADVQVVTMRREWAGVIVPSKFQAAFAVGKPVLFLGPLSSDPARWIRESGGGWAVEESDKEGLRQALAGCLSREERLTRGKAAYEYACRHFNKALNCESISKVIEEPVTLAG